MKTLIKRYNAFLPTWYKWCVLLLAPVAIVVLSGLLAETFYAHVVCVMGFMLILFVEMTTDYTVFGGICSKNSIKLDYLKSSFYGNKLLFAAIGVDMARKCIWLFVVIFAEWFMVVTKTGQVYTIQEALFTLALSLFGYSVVTLSANILRYIDGMQLYLTIDYLICSLAVIAGTVFIMDHHIKAIKDYQYILILSVMTAVAVIVSLFTYWHMKKRIERSYMDE